MKQTIIPVLLLIFLTNCSFFERNRRNERKVEDKIKQWKQFDDLTDERLTIVAREGIYEIINIDGYEFLVVNHNNIVYLHNCEFNK